MKIMMMVVVVMVEVMGLIPMLILGLVWRCTLLEADDATHPRDTPLDS